ncbi:Mitochondrial import inner membrane translocase subunit TIM23 [Cyphellophora attinorum]|uniref:Mitochondrial import inner membrane translocase subunit TIM23 n=1 Tax=Cyphellophora attinorum TaxID=1664694 RepID=A0A0N1HHP1_9EURO|nr:Mitochondrial import inner membrane translocase subunit TIM23 [Phialophora attinorum]KPI45582.1 Mitochondrial import inner membrane translocase subunit TIM23 [Phialophora attinorum]
MSVWDAFTGRKKSSQQQSQQQPPPPSPTDYASTPSSPSSSSYAFTPSIPSTDSFLGSASLPDASQLHPLAGLNQQTLDYLSLDESTLSSLPGSQSVLPSRGWSDDLCYGTGSVYLAALTTGGAWGLIEGLNRVPASAPPKLRLNSVLNSMTRRGPFMGNSAGVVAMCYNGINSTIGYYRGRHDAGNSVAAGALSGMVFRSTKGTKQMLISGAVVAGIAGAWAITRKVVFEPPEPKHEPI